MDSKRRGLFIGIIGSFHSPCPMTSGTRFMGMRIYSPLAYGTIFLYSDTAIIRGRCVSLLITGAMATTTGFVISVFSNFLVTTAACRGTARVIVSIVVDDNRTAIVRRRDERIISVRTFLANERARDDRSWCCSASVRPNITVISNDVQLAQVCFESKGGVPPIRTTFIDFILIVYRASGQSSMSHTQSLRSGFITNVCHECNELTTGYVSRNHIIYRLLSQFVIISLTKSI